MCNFLPDPHIYDGRNPTESNYQPYNGNSNQKNFNPTAPLAPLAPQNQPFPSKYHSIFLTIFNK